jgi:hypothetical protein
MTHNFVLAALCRMYMYVCVFWSTQCQRKEAIVLIPTQ